MDSAETLLEVNDISVKFQVPGGGFWRYDDLHAVRGVSLSINAGEILGVVGESGCGKSTLARAILRLVKTTSGQVSWQGEDLLNASDERLRKLRSKMQIIFQDPISALNPRISVGEAIAEAFQLFFPELSPSERKTKIINLLDEVGLIERMYDRYPHEISGGQAQRVGIARALACKPSLLICDEPVSALDVSVQAQILNLLSNLRKERGLAMMFISHDLSVMRHICDKMMVLYLGKVVESAITKDLFDSPKHPYTKALLDSAPSLDFDNQSEHKALQGEIPSPINPPSGCSFRQRCPHAIDECAKTVPSLESVGQAHELSCIRWEELEQNIPSSSAN